MLKSRIQNDTWLIQQPHHAQVSGYLAAHWGGRNGFVRPGHYPGSTHPARWQDEVVLGIAEHDNGWWEWEAMPRISDGDGLPVGVGEAASPTAANEFTAWRSGGFDRWRIGIDRIAQAHPYSALLVSLHAYWLYAVAFEDLAQEDISQRRHFVFGTPEVAAGLVGNAETTRQFLAEQSATQEDLKRRVAEDPVMADAIEPRHLSPHVRLLQLFDSMSLFLALNDAQDHDLPGVPRAGWDDPCTIRWRKQGTHTILLDPYPFGIDPLHVSMPVRIKRGGEQDPGSVEASPLARLHGIPLQTVEFVFVSERTQNRFAD